MFPRVLALCCALAAGAPAAVVLRQDPADAFKALADRLHATAIDVRAGAPAQADSGGSRLEMVAHGTGTLLRGGLAITSLHAVAVPDASGKMTPLPHVEVWIPDQEPVQARVIAGAPQADLALLELPSSLSSLEGAELADGPPAIGEPLVAMGIDDEGVVVVGAAVEALDGDLIALAGKKLLDSRFWGGPLYGADGKLAGVVLMSLGRSKAVSAAVIQRMLDQRPRTPAPYSHRNED
jgi:S1-C subfamily serine protease